MIASYTFYRETPESLIPILTVPRNPEFDGAVILAEPVDGRWAERKSALEFRRPGSRVRVNIPGEFPAFTFICWPTFAIRNLNGRMDELAIFKTALDQQEIARLFESSRSGRR